MAVISDFRTLPDANYRAQLWAANDYYAFGSQMPGRSVNLGSYRYGFNGKENDSEVKGDGNQQDYGMRIYDPRIAKFLSVDPITSEYPELTPYQFASNTPIWATDRDGLEANVGLKLYGIWKDIERWWNSPANAKEVQGLTYQINSTQSQDLSEGALNGISKGYFWSMQFGLAAMQFGESTPGTIKVKYPKAPRLRTPQMPHVQVDLDVNSTRLKVATYETNKVKGMAADHIPSFASLKNSEELKLGRSLTASEELTLKNTTLTLSIDKKLHQTTSETYGGRNNKVVQAKDAANPLDAIKRNVNKYRGALLKEGYSDKDIDNAIRQLSQPFEAKKQNNNGSN